MTTGSRYACVSVCVVAAMASVAGQGALSGPTIGFVWSEHERTVRPLHGVLGSATLGRPLNWDLPVIHAASLDHQHVVVTAFDGATSLVRLRNGEPRLLLHLSAASPTLPPALSSAGRAFALAAAGLITVVRGLPASPWIAATIDMGTYAGDLTAMSVSDDGRMLAYVLRSGAGSAIMEWTEDGGIRGLGGAEDISAIAVDRRGRIAIANASRNQVQLVSPDEGGGVWELLAGPTRGVSRPAALAVTEQGVLHVANAGTSEILSFDESGRQLETLGCDCDLTSLRGIRPAMYLLTEGSDRTMHILDATTKPGRVYFVPRGTW